MHFTEKIIRRLASEIIQQEVEKGIRKARMALPITANYDPKNEGYRRLTAGGQQRRDLSSITQDRMFEIAYFMFDTSAMVKGLATMDKSFLFSEPITVTSEDKDVQQVIDDFWNDPANKMDLDFPNHMMWLGLLGEQCWPVEVNKINGHVQLGYIDPANIKDILVNAQNVKEIVQIEIRGRAGGTSKKLNAVRYDRYGASDTFGKLMGECFFFAINHPPNSPRGRSDFLTLFDWIDGLERYGFNYLERAEFMLNFIWDVLLKGMNEEQIREWLQNNPAPEPGSLRAHNENVEWSAITPDLKSQNARTGFDMGKSFIMGALRRPESWFGGGGKAYQTEADQFGQIPIKDLQERQLFDKHVLRFVIQFVIDQAVIAKRLSEKKAEAGFTITMTEISRKDFTKLINGVPQLATTLVVAEDQGWISADTATRLFAFVCNQLGFEVDVEKELKAAKEAPEEKDYEDYVKDA